VSVSCSYCGSTEGPLCNDHVVPRSRGGPDSPMNLTKACFQCNAAKRDKLPSEWLDVVRSRLVFLKQSETE
jgi:5-methylcytosine-specific restriction endonuclease McrA